MEEILKKIANMKGVDFKKETTSWFNGTGFFPHHTYQLKFDFKEWTIESESEWRVSNAVRSNKNAQDPMSSVYLWNIKASKQNRLNVCDFKLSKSSKIDQLLGRKFILLEPKNAPLIQHFTENKALLNWFNYSDYPIDNTFECKVSKSETVLFTAFNTSFNSEEKITAALSIFEYLCDELDVINNTIK